MVKKLSPARPATVKTSRVKSEGVEKSTPSIQREARPVAAQARDRAVEQSREDFRGGVTQAGEIDADPVF